MTTTNAHDVSVALRGLEDRLADLDETLMELRADIPGDPGVTRWPPMLAEAIELIEDERALIEQQIRALCAVRRQMGLTA